MSITYGYARVSTIDQNEQRQLVALFNFPVKETRVFVDKVSGATFERPAYKDLLNTLSCGDLLVIKSIDRLGRNYSEIQEQWRYLTHDRMIDIVVLDTPLLDTRDRDGNLTGVFISDLVLQILSYVAETERANIKQRQAEGIAIAQAKGVRFGRPPKCIPEGFACVFREWKRGLISTRKAAKILGVASPTFLKWVADRTSKEQLPSAENSQ